MRTTQIRADGRLRRVAEQPASVLTAKNMK
jgi:hypothetical protein